MTALVASSLITLIALIPATVRASTLYVGGSGPGNYTTIQQAVDAATPGDTIFVYAGIYKERVTVTKVLSLTGEDREATVIDGESVGDVVRITADWVNMTRFKITNSSFQSGDAGLELDSVQNCHVYNNNASDNQGTGILLSSSSYNVIENNSLYGNVGTPGAGVSLSSAHHNYIGNNTAIRGGDGIRLYRSNYNVIAGNNASSNWDYGISLYSSVWNEIENNSILDSWGRGILVSSSDSNSVYANRLVQNYIGIGIERSSYNNITKNILLNTWTYGIKLRESSHNHALNNTLWKSSIGFYVDDAMVETIDYNIISESSSTDIELDSSTSITITNNTMMKGIQVTVGLYYSRVLSNWNTHTIPTSNIVNGKPIYYWKNITGGVAPLDAAQIILANCTDIIVDGLRFDGVAVGVEAGFSHNLGISNISVTNATYGILLGNSHQSVAQNLSFVNSSQMGIRLSYSNDNVVTNSTFLGGHSLGIYFTNSFRNKLENVNVSDNEWHGFNTWYSGDNILVNSTLHANRGTGVQFSFSNNNTVINNSIINEWRDGVSLDNSDNNTITNNTIASNDLCAISLENSIINRIYHNDFLDNGQQAFDNRTNIWNDSYSSGGNFWSDYNGTDLFNGPNQDIPGGDGIGDLPYNISGGSNKDRYPLMNSSSPPPWRPSAPQNLQATGGIGNITLTWESPVSDGGSEVTGYLIYRGMLPGKVYLITETGNVTAYIDTSLRNGTIYYYKVSAKNAVGEGRRSNEASASSVGVPDPPKGPSAIPGDGKVTLTWLSPGNNGGSPVTNYSVYRGTISGGEVLLTELGVQYTYIDLNVTNGQTHFYQVSATNIVGEGARSDEVSATPGSAPSTPMNLIAVRGDRNVTLSWLPPFVQGSGPVLNYTIYRGFSSGSETYLTSIGNVTMYTDTGLTNGLTYFYKVAAVNAFGEGPLSAGASATPATVPGPPTGVVAMNGLSRIILQWQTPSNNGGFPVTNYSVYRGLAPGGESHLVTIGNMLTYTDLNVVNGQRYYYVVSAINAVGEGPLSLEVSAVPCDKPSAPLNLEAVGSDGKVELTWAPPATDNGTPVTNYFVYRSVVPAPESLLVTLGSVLNYTDAAVTNGQLYTYRVSAKNMAGEGSKSNAASATPASVPGSPIGLAAVAGGGQVTLTWNPPASDGGVPITNYVVYRGFSSGTAFPLTTLGNVLTHTDTGLTNGQTYYYQVSAVNARGEGPRSNEASATPVTTPSPPRNLVARSEIEQVTLTWVQPSNNGGSPVVNYSIYRGTTQGGETFLMSVGNVLTHTDTNVVVGVTYHYEVTAHNTVGESQRSNEASATPLVRPTPPSAPLNLQATAGNRHVTLIWSPPASDGNSPITNYRIYEGTSQGNEVFLAELGNVLTYTSISLTNGQTYHYVVKAWNTVGESVASNGASATPVTLPGPPLGLAAVAGDGQVTISWLPPTDDGGSPVIGYEIYRGTSPGDETLRASVGTVLNYTDTGLTNGQRYFYSVSARSAAGEGTLSSEVSAIPRLHTGNMLPLCTITSPSEGSTVSGTVLLAGTAEDLDGVILRVEVKIGDNPWVTATGTMSWAYAFNTTTVADGQHTIRVRSYDGTDYSSEQGVTVNVDNVEEPSEGPLLEQGWFWGLVLMAIIGIVLIAYMLLERRRRPPVDEGQEEGGED